MQAQFVIIGGGIAGVSAAYFLAERVGGDKVVLVEAEKHLAHHTTGRSAAILVENYGEAPIRALTQASLGFLHSPPPHLVDGPILSPRGSLFVASAQEDDQIERLVTEAKQTGVVQRELTPEEASLLCPALRTEPVNRALYEPEAADIDVAGLHQAFVRGFRQAGGTIKLSWRVDEIVRSETGWRISAGSERLDAETIVNATGAWGDAVAELAGIVPLGLTPMRRTIFTVASPFGGSADWPLVSDAKHTWYAKPDGQQFLCSPADETPSEPCDAKPDELDIARAIEKVNDATELEIRSVRSSWAGLRTFAPDRSIVIGADPDQPSFMWLVGQGGTGIQTSPAAGQLVANLLVDGAPGTAFDAHPLDLSAIQPNRFR